MKKIGIICPSEIAFRRFLPALKQVNYFTFTCIGVASAEEWYGQGVSYDIDVEKTRIEKEKAKAQTFLDEWGGG